MSAHDARPRLSVVIVTWNRWSDTRVCLESLRAASLRDIEILVVDNGSSDQTVAQLREHYRDVRLLCNAHNTGHSHAVNQGIEAAQGDAILVLDADTEVASDALATMLNHLEAHPAVGVVAPRTLNTDGSVQQTARAFPRPINGLFGRQSLLTRLFPGNPLSRRYLGSDQLDVRQPFRVEQVSGACMMFRRELVTRVGPWDEGYFAYWVDSDWCYKVGAAGYAIDCVPTALVVHHEQNRAGRRRSLHRIWHFHYGAYRFYRNNMTLGAADPRALLALLALTVHGVWQWLANFTLPADGAPRESSPAQAER